MSRQYVDVPEHALDDNAVSNALPLSLPLHTFPMAPPASTAPPALSAPAPAPAAPVVPPPQSPPSQPVHISSLSSPSDATQTTTTTTMAFAQTLLRKMLSDSLPEKHYDIFFIIPASLPDETATTASSTSTSISKLGAHKVVLSAVSSKFEQHTKDCEILIENCSVAAVKESLEIIYGGELSEARHSVTLALDVWRFGYMFQVDHLITLARSCSISNLSNDNCLRILDFAVTVNDTQIIDKLQNYASETSNFSYVISSPYFKNLHFNVVSSIVRPGKGECAWPEILTFEKVWFDALVKWLAARVSSLERTEENVKVVENALALMDFSRMKTHELRDVSRNEIACLSTSFSHLLVDILLTRSEQLESSILERNIDLDVIGQKYQQALCEQDEAQRKAKAAFDKMDKLHASKISLEKKLDDLRRKKTTVTESSGPTASHLSINSTRRKMSGTSTII